MIQRTHALLEVHGQSLQDAIRRVENQTVDSGVQLFLLDFLVRVGGLELLAHLVAAALHNSGLVQVQALLHYVQLHQSQVFGLIVLQQKAQVEMDVNNFGDKL